MSRSARNGLSVIEALVIIAIVVVLIGLMLPPVRRVREAAERMSCQNNLKQMMLGLVNYSDRFPVNPSLHSGEPQTDHMLPPGCSGPGAIPEERLSWMVALLPDLEQDPLYKQFDLEKGYEGNLPPAQTRIKMFICPSSKKIQPSHTVTSYVAMAGLGPNAATQPAGAAGNGFMGYDRPTSWKMITDGTSNTIASMEAGFHLGPWARGGPSTLRGFDPSGPSLEGDNPPFGGHGKVFNAAFADGSVHSIATSIDPKILAACITIAGGDSSTSVDLN
jgi:prepilin-type processing-associated H-X9-DG protein